ncbi:hypothetical protein D3C80_1423170 [compost metagenome]
MLRDPQKLEIDNNLVEIVKGDVRDYVSVLELVKGCSAVLSTLGQPKGESPIFSDATKNIITAMNHFDINRYIAVTGLSIDVPTDKKSPKTRQLSDWMKQNFPEIIADKQKEFSLLSNSILNWTLVRLPMIEQTDNSGNINISLEDCPGDKISATDLANFMITQLTDTTYIGKSPFIASI